MSTFRLMKNSAKQHGRGHTSSLLTTTCCLVISGMFGACQSYKTHPADTSSESPPSTSVVTQDTAIATTTVNGTITYRQRIALPEGAVIIINVADVSRADAPSKTIGEQMITTRGEQVPIGYRVEVPTGSIDPKADYAVSVRIEDNGKLIFISTTRYSVLTKGNPTTQDIVVEPVP